MVYRFKLVSDEVSNFSREIEIDSENTFLQLRNTILESVGYSKDEIDSFFLCNEDWEKQEEITLEDMGDHNSDRDVWLMQDTSVGDLIEDEGQRLFFEYDYFGERGFFMELKEILPMRHLLEPMCSLKLGKAPEQFVVVEDVEPAIDIKNTTPDVEQLDLNSFGEPSFDDEELDSGFDIMDMN